MQTSKGLQIVLLLGAIFTCLAFLSKPPNISYNIEKDNYLISIPNLNLATHSTSPAFKIILLKTQNRLRSEIQERVNKIENLCVKNKKTRRFETVVSKIIIDVEHGLSWCPIYKAASSTWMRQFAALRGILTDKMIKEGKKENLVQISTLVNRIYQNELNTNKTLEKINKTKIFLVVRHPFERLLSAYRDKLEYIEGREYYYRRFGRHITYKYRQNKTKNDTRPEPLFVEFLEFIVKEKYFDEHWIPYCEACMPCDIKYDYILKFEKFKEESSFLLSEIGLKDLLNFNDGLNNSNPRGITTKSVIKNYYKDVPVSLLKELFNVYEMDFKLFSYSPEEYYLLGKKNE